MECKVLYGACCRIAKEVLIETLWNVKLIQSFKFSPVPQSINRSIVECKDVNGHIDYQMPEVLIETLWNVKSNSIFALEMLFPY